MMFRGHRGDYQDSTATILELADFNARRHQAPWYGSWESLCRLSGS